MRFVPWSALVPAALALAGRLRGRVRGVVGVPRSGLMPAAIVAQTLGLPLACLECLPRAGAGLAGAFSARCREPFPDAGPVAVVDDSSYRGSALRRALEALEPLPQYRPVTAALFGAGPPCDPSPEIVVDVVPAPRLFAWNWLGHACLSEALFDFDGCLCPDPATDAESPDHEAELARLPPLHLPLVPIQGVVTARLESLSPVSLAWLARHGVQAGSLYMHPAASVAERRRSDVAAWKAHVYVQAGARLFVESDPALAARIAALACRPVLCVGDWKVYP